MDVILLRDVDHLGIAGNRVAVKDGYARNFLIPRGLAAAATTASAAAAGRSLQELKRQQEKLKQKAAEMAERLSRISCTIPVSVGEQGKLHGAVTATDIVKVLTAQGIQLEKHQIILEDPIHRLGEHQVNVKFHPEVSVPLTVSVVRA